MLFDWSAECSADDPVLVIPWDDPATQLRFVDLRDDPDALDHVQEAEDYPALLSSLRALNAARSPLFSAKCDVWEGTEEEREYLRLSLMLQSEEAVAATLSYLDLLCRDRSLFASFHQHQHLLQRIERRLVPLNLPFVAAEAIIRPALLDLTSPQEGFAISFYTKAVGTDDVAARENWTEGLRSLTTVLRSRDLIPQT